MSGVTCHTIFLFNFFSFSDNMVKLINDYIIVIKNLVELHWEGCVPAANIFLADREKPGAALQSSLSFIHSVTHPKVSHSFKAPPRPND